MKGHKEHEEREFYFKDRRAEAIEEMKYFRLRGKNFKKSSINIWHKKYDEYKPLELLQRVTGFKYYEYLVVNKQQIR